MGSCLSERHLCESDRIRLTGYLNSARRFQIRYRYVARTSRFKSNVPILLQSLPTSETDADGMAVEIEPSRQQSVSVYVFSQIAAKRLSDKVTSDLKVYVTVQDVLLNFSTQKRIYTNQDSTLAERLRKRNSGCDHSQVVDNALQRW